MEDRDSSKLPELLCRAVSNEDVGQLKQLCAQLRRMPSASSYQSITQQVQQQAQDEKRTSVLDFINQDDPFHYNAHNSFSELMLLHDGIEDGDWDEEHALGGLRLMLKRGWDPRVKTVAQTFIPNSPLLFCLRKQSFVEFLLSHGYDPNERYSSGSDALTEVLALGLPTSTLTLLITHNFDTQATSTKALHVAAAEPSSLGTMAVLVEAGVPINALAERLERRNVSRKTNPYRGTPLHFAAEAGQIENVIFLLEHGAALDVKDSVGKYPLQRVPKACTDSAELMAQSPSR